MINVIASALVINSFLLLSPSTVFADDELANYAAQGNKVGVDGTCFMRKCAIETSNCASNPSCLKGLACLARCQGGSMCSTGCFAKFGSANLDNLLYCSVEKNDCVQVPGKESSGWLIDEANDLPSSPLKSFNMASLQGTWYKIMGLDSRYDCFDCQRNRFDIKNKETLKMEALFRIPRQTFPGYLQSKITEELHATQHDGPHFLSHMQSKGLMFGLTFWENWYILGDVTAPSLSSTRDSEKSADRSRYFPIQSALAESKESDSEPVPELKLVFYTGHTLQGSYKGAFVYSRSAQPSAQIMNLASEMIQKAGMNPRDFCVIRNQCFLTRDGYDSEVNKREETPFWFIGQKFFRVTNTIAQELADWFEDPAILSDWLVNQQQRTILERPLEVSPFAELGQ